MTRLMTATAAAALIAGAAFAEPAAYTIDKNHSEILFTWSHGEFSTTRGMFFEVDGEVMYDEAEPANSSVSITLPTESMLVTPELKTHLMSGDFFGDAPDPITFESTSIEVTGENTADITGDLTVNGQTKEVVLKSELTKSGQGPMGNPVTGFAATTTVLRSDYGLGAFTPFVSDEVEVQINLETSPAS